MSIINVSEVLRLSPAAKNLESRPKPICDIIDHVEESKMIKLVGWDNYQDMIADKKDFSAVQKWNDEATYLEGAQVVYKGIVYEADENITNNNTPNDCSQ